HSDPNTNWNTGYTLFSVMYDDAKPKFTGAPSNIPLNAVLFAQKVYGYPIDWTCAIAMDCYIDVDGHIKINTMCQLIGCYSKEKYLKIKQMDPLGLINGFNEKVIYSLEQLHINWHEIFKAIWEAAIKYACDSKICR
ncbi:MAG: hypothetical protein EZS28_023676, partial [Streblomastix strix]